MYNIFLKTVVTNDYEEEEEEGSKPNKYKKQLYNKGRKESLEG